MNVKGVMKQLERDLKDLLDAFEAEHGVIVDGVRIWRTRDLPSQAQGQRRNELHRVELKVSVDDED